MATQRTHCYFLACDGNYLPFAALAAKRAGELSATSTRGYILYAGPEDDRFEAVSRVLPPDVEMVDASRFLDGLSLNFSARITKATYLRIFADLVPQFEPYERVAYFDCDVLLNRDPAELLSSAMSAPLLAAHDLPSYYDLDYRRRLSLRAGAPYFNAGVLVFDMPAVRNAGLLEKARQFATDHMELCVQHDQDAMNVAFEGSWQTLHPLWNAMTNLHWMPAFTQTYARHFSSKKPWSRNPVGVESEAMAIYRRLAAGTEWAQLFQSSSTSVSLSLAIKRIERKARTAIAHLGRDQRRLRRARFEEKLPSITARLAEHADSGVAGLEFPEREFGLG
ncbi:glycosyltransferase [Mesorhizobium comanense]|uniref:glycosyltransferase n=1 Tax=Mesorhizobium comanense TaxID=2502215 RepID=UPI0010F8267C|nr:glycosyltransferase [Mesorhizobium comanense]